MKLKTVKITYWTITIIFALLMLFSGLSELMQTKQGNLILQSLSYPIYLNIILGLAKILGVIAILQTRFKTIKEWAYAGFTIDILGATLSFVLAGKGALAVLTILPFILILFLSYFFWKKMNYSNN